MPAAGQKTAETSQPAPEATAEARDREIAELREAVRQLQASPGTQSASKPSRLGTPKGKNYEALTHLSVGRATTGKEGDRSADIVHRGETVFLTEEQARGFLDPRRHRRPVIREASEQNEPAPPVTARDLFGQQPRAQQFAATLPDPPGASKVIERPDPEAPEDPADPRNAPEASEPAVDPG